jgi:hypothetical protein
LRNIPSSVDILMPLTQPARMQFNQEIGEDAGDINSDQK